MKAYTIKSSLTGKYLTGLFRDKHDETFTANEFDRNKCYWYKIRSIAQNCATQLGGTLEEVEIKGGEA